MDFLSGAGSCYPSRAHDSMTVTVVSGDFVSDSYPYADVLVPTSGLSLNFFPGISSPIDCFLKFCFSHNVLYVLSHSSHVRLFVTSWTLCPWEFPGKNTGVDCHALF